MSYKTFYKVFLTEMPWKVAGSNDFEFQIEALQEMINDGHQIISVTPSIFKIESGDQITFWYGNSDATSVALIVDTNVEGTICKVVLTSKNPSIAAGSKPFASDLYVTIMRHLKMSNIAFSSDGMMSDDAIRLWSRLISLGHTISVFNTATHNYELIKVNSIEELNNFIGGPDMQKYIYVISESDLIRSGLRHSIAIMEIKRKSGYPLFEQYTSKK